MDNAYEDALRYLSTPSGSFWKWDDQGAVVVWTNGSTLAFREELTFVLQALGPSGLPSLDAVLLLIAATRAYWAQDSFALQTRLRGVPVTLQVGATASEFASELFGCLNVIHQLSDEFHRHQPPLDQCAKLVFEAAPRVVTSDVAKIVVDILAKRLNDSLPNLAKLAGGRPQTTKSLVHDLWPLRNGLEGMTKESLLLLYRTGLNSAPDTVEIDFTVDQTAMRSLLRELADDEELAGLSRLARNLAAVVQLPRAISDSDELPLGGVSDLSNRGTLDRLVLSELAHDDLMLAMRVALNEALYLRREVPPSFPPERRHVLIDAGLRMWGVPRVFSTAVVLSLAASGGKATSLAAYRASGADVVPIDLTTRDGLVSHLAALEPEVHPGRALTRFFQHVTDSEIPGDIILVTTDVVLEDPDFQRTLSDADPPNFYQATVNRDGDFQLWSRGPRGRKCHSTLRLDLDELMTPSQRKASRLVDSTIDQDLPAIFRKRPFPLRLPFQPDRDFTKEVVWSVRIPPIAMYVSPEQSTSDASNVTVVSGASPVTTRLDYRVLVLTHDRRLLCFDDSVRGAVQIGEGLPFGRCLGSWLSDDGRQSFAVIHRQSDVALYLFEVDLVDLSVKTDQLRSPFLSYSGPGSQLLGTTTHGGTLFVIYRSMIEAYDVATKQLLDSTYTELPENWKRGRYFWNPALCHSDAWFALSFDGTAICFQRVPQGRFLTDGAKLALFDRKGIDGAFAIDERRRLLNLSEQTFQLMMHHDASGIQIMDIDADGRRAMVRYTGNFPGLPERRIVDTSTGLTTIVSNVDSLTQLDATRANMGLQPMKRLTQVFVGDEQLILVSNGHVMWKFNVQSQRLLLTRSDAVKAKRLSLDFQSVKTPSLGYSLRVAKWEDGSRIWVDSRGLLHLQSSDPMIPETTIVLVAAAALWTSDGRMLGASYYVDDSSPTISPNEVMQDILTPFISRLR